MAKPATPTVEERLALAHEMLGQIANLAYRAGRMCYLHEPDTTDPERSEMLIFSLEDMFMRAGWMAERARYAPHKSDMHERPEAWFFRGPSLEAMEKVWPTVEGRA